MNLVMTTADVIVDEDNTKVAFTPLLAPLNFLTKGDFEHREYKVSCQAQRVCNLMGNYYDAVLITFLESETTEERHKFDVLVSQFGNFISNTVKA